MVALPSLSTTTPGTHTVRVRRLPTSEIEHGNFDIQDGIFSTVDNQRHLPRVTENCLNDGSHSSALPHLTVHFLFSEQVSSGHREPLVLACATVSLTMVRLRMYASLFDSFRRSD